MLEDHPRRLFFLLVPGGTGKTGSLPSGVASLLLKGGRTAHATFRISLNSTDTSSCSVEKDSELANLLRAASLIVWDEAPMAHPATPLRPSIGCYATFATRTNGSAASWWSLECLPVVLKGTEDQIGRVTISNSPFWPSLRILELRKNMRLLLRAQDMTAEENARARRFSHWLLAVGDGSANEEGGPQVKIPDDLLLPEHERSCAGLIAFVYDGLDALDSINATLLAMVPGDVSEYRSADDTAEAAGGLDDGLLGALLSPEHLNTFDVRNFPPHLLKIKVGTPVILLHNVDPEAGLCNSTRLLISRAMSRVLEGIILTGDCAGDRFPVRPAFAMTINKAQGQLLERVGVDLSTHPVFSHGQLYVALSRATSAQGCKVLLPPPRPLDDPVGVDGDGDVAMQEAQPQPSAATANPVIAWILARVHGST
ncbi:BQ2448_206 [Microbotryum intermedium]|uniref:ATP-dependent DNA helicase n=1 Tax=Microbotryum intermedium TaxID=269621 RepID=A0A238F4W3_9BASI|nr:BQ2448_206 [Microbotryum intermedium]